MKKRMSLPLLLLLVCCNSSLLAQNWLWAQNFTGDVEEAGRFIAAYPNGNIYCFGEYVPSGSVTADSVTISSGGHFNAFVSEFDQTGNFIAITNVKSTSVNPSGPGGVSFSSEATIDNSNNLYIGLTLSDNALIDTIPLTGARPLYQLNALSKWNTNSRCLWAKYYPGLMTPKFYRNNIYINGNYQQDTLQIDSFQLYDPANKTQGYLAALNSAGTCKWVKQAIGGNTGFNFIDADNAHIYVSALTDSCFIYDTLHVCGGHPANTNIIMQLDTNGSVNWYKVLQHSDPSISPIRIVAIASGGIYADGVFDSTLYLGDDTLNKLGTETADYFLAKFDDGGNLLWESQIPITGGLVMTICPADSLGYFYATGYITGTQSFGNYTVTAQSPNDLFVARYNPSGTCLGVVTVPNAEGLDITQDSAGNAIITGGITSTTVFGNITLTCDLNSEFFVAKLSAIPDTSTGFSLLAPYDNHLQIYANPSQGLFTIEVPQGIVHANSGTLTIYNDMGSIILNSPEDLSSGHLKVDLGAISRGVYAVLLSANSKQYMGRLVIQ